MKMGTVCKLSKSALDLLVSDFSLFLSEKVESLEKEMHIALRGRGLELDAGLSSLPL